jgi:erythromycin esterase-like protein
MDAAVEIVARQCHPLTGGKGDYDALLERTRDARFVLIGEATHGTHEFYAERARITRLLIERQGFDAVAAEADWPDAWRVNQWVRGEGEDPDAESALAGFERFPTWMWRNADVLDFAGWLRAWNDDRKHRPVGFYGLDMYSMNTSIAAVIAYLEGVDPEAARRARDRYGCFERYGYDPQRYGRYAGSFQRETCEADVIRQLRELQDRPFAAGSSRDAHFQAEQNARLVRDAEQYYRAMFRADESSWNLRDTHMVDTLDALADHLSVDRPAKIVVWEHNSHVGDARATAVGGQLNVGQLVRQRHANAVLVGFTTFDGSVTAASGWDEPPERKRVRPALSGSWERLFHDVDVPRFLLRTDPLDVRTGLVEPRLERAIGVLYLPETERQSHYFYAVLPRQFDVVIHLDHTRAVEPLDPPARWHREREEPPEAYPTGL